MSQNLTYTTWRKSSRSSPSGQCVEVGFTPDAATTGIRDTKYRSYGTLAVSAGTWSQFLATVKSGKLDQ